MRVSSVDTSHLICLTDEEAGLLVDLCHAGAFSEHIASSPERRERVDAFLWRVQQSLLPAVQKHYGSTCADTHRGAHRPSATLT
jgi:hypothetical protein